MGRSKCEIVCFGKYMLMLLFFLSLINLFLHRLLYKQLTSENSHEKFDERRITVLKSQVIQLERQVCKAFPHHYIYTNLHAAQCMNIMMFYLMKAAVF